MKTKAQAYYLYYLGIAEKKERTISGLAKRLNVTMASVSKMIGTLEEANLVTRDHRALKLTAEGRSITKQLREEHQVLMRWMKRHHLAPADSISEDAYRYLIEMGRGCVEATMNLAKKEDARDALLKHTSFSLAATLPDGDYTVPFTLFQSDREQISMGDLGFHHPCKLVVVGGRGLICLRAKSITYQNRLGIRLSGRLTSLEYWNGSDYVSLKRPLWYEEWQIPICCPELRKSETGLSLTVHIRARASCGIANMPRSDAYLTVNIEKFFNP